MSMKRRSADRYGVTQWFADGRRAGVVRNPRVTLAIAVPVLLVLGVVAAVAMAANNTGKTLTAAIGHARNAMQMAVPMPTAGPASSGMDCNLAVPANPLSAQGLATPYQLSGAGCNEANTTTQAFAQATIYDPATGKLSTYQPLVVTQGMQPAIPPVVPTLPAGAVVTLNFGFNGNNLTLVPATQAAGGGQPAPSPSASAPAFAAASTSPSTSGFANGAPVAAAQPAFAGRRHHHGGDGNGRGGGGNSLQQGRCVNGLRGSIFGQVSFCNARAFYRAVNWGIAAGRVTIPGLGTAKDGQACPTVRSFTMVDQDQSDNVTSMYLVTSTGQTAQDNAANVAQLGAGTTPAGNGSDNRLLDNFLDTALSCAPFTAPDLSNGGTPSTSQPLNELQAAAGQQAPLALVPPNDPMTQVNGAMDLRKTNLYRVMVDQPPLAFGTNLAQAATDYCTNLLKIQVAALQRDQATYAAGPPPDPAVGNNLFTFMAARLSGSFTNLNCGNFGLTNPVQLTLDGNGVATAATFGAAPSASPSASAPASPTASPTGSPTATATTPTTPPTGRVPPQGGPPATSLPPAQ